MTVSAIDVHYCGERGSSPTSTGKPRRQGVCNDRAAVQVREDETKPWRFICGPHWQDSDQSGEVVEL